MRMLEGGLRGTGCGDLEFIALIEFIEFIEFVGLWIFRLGILDRAKLAVI